MSSTPTSAPSTASTTWPSTGPAPPSRPRSRRSRSGSAACRWPASCCSPTATAPTSGDLDWSSLPPIYPVVPPSRGVARDVGVREVSVSQTNFESAPVVLRADVAAVGFAGESIVAVRHRRGRQGGRAPGGDADRRRQAAELPLPVPAREAGGELLHGPRLPGLGGGEDRRGARTPAGSSEQTLANNSRLVVVDQGGGPYRVLYVGGRPNWEFKFLRRALDDDEQVQLVGLLRIARRQPKFDFQAARNRTTSPLFDGFDHPDPDTAERADQPVLVRLGTLDEVGAEGRLPQGRRGALPLPRGHPRRHRGRLLHARTSSPCCGTSSASAAAGS